MRLAIMQPYLFPYLGHFSLIASCDEWIVFDTCQYTPKTWMNRNRVLHPTAGWKWLTAPLANGSIHITAAEARLLDPARLRTDLPNALSHYRRAPHYRRVMDLLAEILAPDDPSLVRLNLRALRAVCRELGLPFRARLCSELGLRLPPDLGPGGWAPAIAAALGASTYVNPIGGRHLFDPADFTRRGIALHFLRATPFTPTVPPPLTRLPDLSVLDALMWTAPDDLRAAVRAYDLVVPEPAIA